MNKNKFPDDGIDLQDSFIAPWGLSTEELPLHLIWDGETDRVELILPNSVEIREIHNTDIDIENSNQVVSIQSEELSTAGFFGAVLSVSKIHSKSIVPYTVEVHFYKNGIVQHVWHGTTRIIRPEIEVINHPDRVVLDEEGKTDEIEIDMQYVGFGMAKVAFEVKSGGEIISQGKSLEHDLLTSLLETEFHKQDIEGLDDIPDEWKHDNGGSQQVEVPKEELDDIVSDMRRMTNDAALLEEYDAEELYEMASILEEAEESTSSESDIASAIYSKIERVLLHSIIDAVDRHPTENVSLENPETKIRADTKLTDLEINVLLSDKIGNNYTSEVIEIPIDDNRKNTNVFESSIVTNWINYEVNPEEAF